MNLTKFITILITFLVPVFSLAEDNCKQGSAKKIATEALTTRCQLESKLQLKYSTKGPESVSFFFTEGSISLKSCGKNNHKWKPNGGGYCYSPIITKEIRKMIEFSGNNKIQKAFESSTRKDITIKDIRALKKAKVLNGWGNCFWTEREILSDYFIHKLGGLSIIFTYADGENLWGNYKQANSSASITLNSDCPRTLGFTQKLNLGVLRGAYRLNDTVNYLITEGEYSAKPFSLVNGELIGVLNNHNLFALRKINIDGIDFYVAKMTSKETEFHDYSLFYTPRDKSNPYEKH